jgi:hypothetical protein
MDTWVDGKDEGGSLTAKASKLQPGALGGGDPKATSSVRQRTVRFGSHSSTSLSTSPIPTSAVAAAENSGAQAVPEIG